MKWDSLILAYVGQGRYTVTAEISWPRPMARLTWEHLIQCIAMTLCSLYVALARFKLYLAHIQSLPSSFKGIFFKLAGYQCRKFSCCLQFPSWGYYVRIYCANIWPGVWSISIIIANISTWKALQWLRKDTSNHSFIQFEIICEDFYHFSILSHPKWSFRTPSRSIIGIPKWLIFDLFRCPVTHS